MLAPSHQAPSADLARAASHLMGWGAVGPECQFWVSWRVSDRETLTLPGKECYRCTVPSHSLSPGPKARIRRRPRRRESRRRLRDWRTWGVFLAFILVFWLSGWMVGRFWPKAHGVGYLVTHVVVRGVLGGAIGAVLVVVVVILAGIVRDRRFLP